MPTFADPVAKGQVAPIPVIPPLKGAGEGAIIPMGGLMANAVANALTSLGAMPNQLPLSPARVWHMSSAKQSTRGSG